MARLTVEELDSKIPAIQKDLNDFFGERVHLYMNELLTVGCMPILPTVWLGGANQQQHRNELLVNSLFAHNLISKDQYNRDGDAIYRITDLGYLYCLRTPEIWDRERSIKINKHSLVVLNPNDYDQNESVYALVAEQNKELLLLDYTHEKFNAIGERIYHQTASIDELIHATSEEIQYNRRKDF